MNAKQSKTRAVLLGLAVFLAVITLGICVQDKGAGNLPSTRHEITRKGDSEKNMPPMPPSESFVQKMVLARFPGIDTKVIMKFMQDYFPLELHEFRKLAEWKPSEAMDMLTDLVQESLSLLETKKGDPDLFSTIMRQKQLQKQAARQAELSRKSTSKEKEELLAKLQQTLEEAFKVRQELMKKDIKYVESELGKLRTLVQKREESRATIISRKLSEMTGDKDHLKW